MEIRLNKFNPKILEVCRIKNCFPCVCIISDNVEETLVQQLISSLKISSGNIIRNFTNDVLTIQKKRIQDIIDTGDNPRNHREIDICIVSDDKIMKNRELWFNNRRLKISLIVTIPYERKLPPGARNNFDF